MLWPNVCLNGGSGILGSSCFLIITSPISMKYLAVWLFVLCLSSLLNAPESRACLSFSPRCSSSQCLPSLNIYWLSEWGHAGRKVSLLNLRINPGGHVEVNGMDPWAEFLGSATISDLTGWLRATHWTSLGLCFPAWDLQFQSHGVAVRIKWVNAGKAFRTRLAIIHAP